MNWIKTGTETREGVYVIRYEAAGVKHKYTIESRRQNIPHANGVGTWQHTEYALLANGEMVRANFWRMAEAKKKADEMEKAV